MSKEYMNKCNRCGKVTNDRYAEIGWISIDPHAPPRDTNFTINMGRDSYGQGKAYYKTIYETQLPLEFCCLKCLIDFFSELYSSAESTYNIPSQPQPQPAVQTEKKRKRREKA